MNYEDDHKEDEEVVDTDKLEAALDDEAAEDEDESAPSGGHDAEEGYE